VGEPEGKPEAVAVATQALKAETPERLAVKRLADMQATGADIDQQKAMLARGEVKDPVAYAEIEGEIEGKSKARMALEGGMPAAATPDTTAVALPARTSAQAAKDAELVREMAHYDMSKPADVAAYAAKKTEILGE